MHIKWIKNPCEYSLPHQRNRGGAWQLNATAGRSDLRGLKSQYFGKNMRGFYSSGRTL